MITTKQRIAFFKLFNTACGISGFGGDKEAWRKAEMMEAAGIASVKLVKTQEDYDALMLHFAQLAQDERAVRHYAVASERRHRFILQAVEADLSFLRGRGCGDAYMEGIYRQAGFPACRKMDDIPVEHLRLLVQIADSHVRKLRRSAGLEPRQLPSAGDPWRIRGVKAANLARRIAPRRADAPMPSQTPVPI
jgi:hypothetical protein